MNSVTKKLLFINIAVFVLLNIFYFMAAGRVGLDNTFKTFGLVPGSFGIWQPFTSMFLHGSFLHILVNMVALWSIGMPIEREIGSKKFLKLYLISGLGGAGLVMLLQDSTSVTIGASGAILGLLGAMAVFFPNALLVVFIFPMRARTAAILFGGVSLLFTFFDQGSGISHAGHLGGLVAGLFYSRHALKTRRAVYKDEYMESDGYFYNSKPDYDYQRIMKEFIKNYRNNPKSASFLGGHFVNPGSGKSARRDEKGNNKKEKTLKLHFDSKTGKFYFG